MVTIRKHPRFQKFIDGISDEKVTAAILARLSRLAMGNPGDHASIGQGVWELRIHLGAGWRVYYVKTRAGIIVLLGGGPKKSQRADIDAALAAADELRTQ